jgi:hypothetical protein
MLPLQRTGTHLVSDNKEHCWVIKVVKGTTCLQLAPTQQLLPAEHPNPQPLALLLATIQISMVQRGN